DAAPFLAGCLKAVQAPEPGRVERHIKDMDSDDFRVRRRAMEELEKFAELAEPALKQALASKPSLELAQRVQRLLERLRGRVLTPEQVRTMRAVEALEKMGTPGARRALEALARGAPGAHLTEEARAALERLPR